jgi:hypothetical protein
VSLRPGLDVVEKRNIKKEIANVKFFLGYEDVWGNGSITPRIFNLGA